MTANEALISLNLLPKIGPVRVRRLVEAFGAPERILAARADELRRVEGIGAELAGILTKWEDHADVTAEMARVREHGLTILTPADEAWPENLREIHDPPLLLYVKGKVEPRDKSAIGVVGSRKATVYGTQCARKFSFQLAHAGVTVLSGLARGIDTAAHEGALAAKGRTIAVIGSGFAKMYPPENEALADRIADGHGAVVSEFPILTVPDKQTFPQRNRIVSGWSQGILVVEAPAWSGALITANMAKDQGRTVYAVPGPVDRASSLGCNKLIQDGASLVIDAGDILDDLNMLLPPTQAELFPAEQAPSGVKPVNLSAEEAALWDALGTETRHIDEIITACALPSGVVSSNLMRMELKRLVKQLPGKHYVRIV